MKYSAKAMSYAGNQSMDKFFDSYSQVNCSFHVYKNSCDQYFNILIFLGRGLMKYLSGKILNICICIHIYTYIQGGSQVAVYLREINIYENRF